MTLRMTDGLQGKAEAPVVWSRAFQLTGEDAHTTPDVVTSMYLLLTFLFMLFFMVICLYFCLGSFLVNSIHALVLFDSGATRSFLSLRLSKIFDDVLG